MPSKLTLDFNNTKLAYQYKSDKELKLAEFLYSSLNTPILGSIGKKLLKFAVNIGLPVKGAIKATLYKQFVGGETLQDCVPIMKKMAEYKVMSILDYSEEGKNDEAAFIHAHKELIKNIEFSAANPEAPLSVFKVTSFASTTVLEKVSAKQDLKMAESDDWNTIQKRCDALFALAHKLNHPLMVDAEESWIQPAIDQLALKGMATYNIENVIILNTFQMYKKDSLEIMHHFHNKGQEQGFKVGAKIVRGAYMEKEAKRASAKGYANPIQSSKDNTDKDYNAALKFCIENIQTMMTVAGTHNEDSTLFAAKLLEDNSIAHNHPHFWFSQLLGMCDFISFNLGANGYNVAKYVPYGPVASVTPYLIRRADENSSVAGQAGKELNHLKSELKNRKLN